MTEHAPIAAVCCVLTGLGYLAYSVLFFFDPCHKSRSAHEFMRLYGSEPRFYLWRSRVLGGASVLALGTVADITRLAGGSSYVRWAAVVAYIGFAANALSNLRTLQILPVVYADYRDADEAARIPLARSISYLALDPRGWFTFGGFGVWLLVVNVVAVDHDTLTGWLGVLGAVLGAVLVIVVPAGVFHRYAVFSGIAASAGMVLAPIWFIATGIAIR